MAAGRLNVRMTPEHEAAIAAEAEKADVTQSRWCAVTIDAALRRRKYKLPPLREQGGLNGRRAQED